MAEKQTILIIGANRGVGNQLTRRLLARGHEVWGTYRPAAKSANDDESVKELGSTGANLLELDLSNEESIKMAAKKFESEEEGKRLDILINVAGIYNLWDEKPFTEHTAEDLMWFFRINTVGPFLTSKYFLSSLSKCKQGKIINVSSDMASISENTGGNVCYRIAKCALNQLTKTQSLDLQKLAPNVITLAVHPGFVATKMTGYYGEDDMETCMSALTDTVERFGKDGEESKLPNGGYVRYDGEKMNY